VCVNSDVKSSIDDEKAGKTTLVERLEEAQRNIARLKGMIEMEKKKVMLPATSTILIHVNDLHNG
jgi:hypothetical protein